MRRMLAAVGLAALGAWGGAPAHAQQLGPSVLLVAEEPDPGRFSGPPPVLDGLAPDSVLRVRVRGFEPFAKGQAQQCVGQSCANWLPVQFDGDGRAFFQYLVTDSFNAASREGQCRAAGAPCTLVVTALEGDQRAEIQTVFHDTVPPPGRITVTPRTGLVDGQTVTVEVAGFPPGARVDAMLCVPPAATGTQRCGSPGPTAPFTIGPDGRGSTRLTIRTGPVGTEGLRCDRSHTCGVTVASEDVFARAPVVPIRFAAPAGADYEAGRLGGGLAVAAGLVGVATWLVRRTDWSPVGEAAAPEIDHAEYADLDAIVAALPPEPDPFEP